MKKINLIIRSQHDTDDEAVYESISYEAEINLTIAGQVIALVARENQGQLK